MANSQSGTPPTISFYAKFFGPLLYSPTPIRFTKIPLTTTILQLKEAISDNYLSSAYPEERLMLTYQGRHCVDDYTLARYNIEPDSFFIVQEIRTQHLLTPFDQLDAAIRRLFLQNDPQKPATSPLQRPRSQAFGDAVLEAFSEVKDAWNPHLHGFWPRVLEIGIRVPRSFVGQESSLAASPPEDSDNGADFCEGTLYLSAIYPYLIDVVGDWPEIDRLARLPPPPDSSGGRTRTDGAFPFPVSVYFVGPGDRYDVLSEDAILEFYDIWDGKPDEDEASIFHDFSENSTSLEIALFAGVCIWSRTAPEWLGAYLERSGRISRAQNCVVAAAVRRVIEATDETYFDGIRDLLQWDDDPMAVRSEIIGERWTMVLYNSVAEEEAALTGAGHC